MTGASDGEAREFAAAFRHFLEWIHSDYDDRDERNEVVVLIDEFLGAGGREHSVVTRRLPLFEHVNLQTAVDAWTAAPGREASVYGISLPPHHDPPELQQLVTGDEIHGVRLSAPALVDLPNGPGTTLGCLLRALLLVEDERDRYAILISGPGEHHGSSLRVEVAGLATGDAQSVLGELDDLRGRLNVYRGHLLDVAVSHGGVALSFAAMPATAREDVILPDLVLNRVERHALGVAMHRQALLDSGQHLKRGLLLYGPPGTGKTHTMRYLVSEMADYTRLMLTGRALQAVGSVAELARDLEPAVIVLEDVDLVAEDRGFGSGSSPVLFDLLNAMDGAAADADLLFLLTTNRADLLEPALAARPGRVDVAVEIDLPGPDARRRLFALYARSVPSRLSDVEVDEVVERTDGVTASFLKELVRRAVLESLRERSPLDTVEVQHLRQALDDLLDTAQSVTRSLLGVGNDPSTLPPGGGARPRMGGGPRPGVMYGSFHGPDFDEYEYEYDAFDEDD